MKSNIFTELNVIHNKSDAYEYLCIWKDFHHRVFGKRLLQTMSHVTCFNGVLWLTFFLFNLKVENYTEDGENHSYMPIPCFLFQTTSFT
jgi:hypothetical protein